MNTSANSAYSPYMSAYDAFNNYMNVLSDFLLRVEEQAPSSIETDELNSYQQTILNQDKRIHELEEEVAKLKAEAKSKAKATTSKASTSKASTASKTKK